MVNNTCISCNILHCAACSASNACSSCQSGYNLGDKNCLCPNGSTISSIDSSCVPSNIDSSCVPSNIDSCYRWHQANTFALFSTSSSKPSLTPGKTVSITILLAILVILTVGLIMLYRKISQLRSGVRKIKDIK
jgi:hypothetical protein